VGTSRKKGEKGGRKAEDKDEDEVSSGLDNLVCRLEGKRKAKAYDDVGSAVDVIGFCGMAGHIVVMGRHHRARLGFDMKRGLWPPVSTHIDYGR
jgi:hypothetical protein